MCCVLIFYYEHVWRTNYQRFLTTIWPKVFSAVSCFWSLQVEPLKTIRKYQDLAMTVLFVVS